MKANQHASPLWRILIPGITLLLLTACSGGGGGGDPGAGSDDPGTTIDKNASVSARSASLALGDADCPHGGILVETGIDENGNGVLDDNEVDAAEKVCNGAPGSDGANGLDSLVAFSDEPPGANCPWGGMKIESGLDANRDGILQSGEVNETSFVCSLVDGDIGWQVGENLSNGSDKLDRPALAVARDGSAVAVWVTGTFDISASRYDPDNGWSMAQAIETNSDDATSPAIAMAPDGSAIAVWWQGGNIWANRYNPKDNAWGDALPLEDRPGPTFIPTITIAMAPDGSAITVWEQQNSSGSITIWANRYNSKDNAWGDALAIGNDSSGKPAIAMASDGSAIVVWRQGGNIWANRYHPETGWGDMPQTIDSGSGDADIPAIAMPPDGSAIATWVQKNSGIGYDIWANRYDPVTGEWGEAQTIENRLGSVDAPTIAMAPDGSAIALWSQWDGTRDAIWSNRFVPGAGWGVAQPAERLTTGNALNPRIGFDGAGNAIALWMQRNAANANLRDIWANRWIAPRSP